MTATILAIKRDSLRLLIQVRYSDGVEELLESQLPTTKSEIKDLVRQRCTVRSDLDLNFDDLLTLVGREVI